MKAHIVGSGFGGLAAAALLIRNADVPGTDITIYEADDAIGGGFFLDGSAADGFNLPEGPGERRDCDVRLGHCPDSLTSAGNPAFRSCALSPTTRTFTR